MGLQVGYCNLLSQAVIKPSAAVSQQRANKRARSAESLPSENPNWRTSIVDLLKMLDLDSSLEARKQLAQELGVNAGPHGSAEQNIALHKAVTRKVAQNGGKVPQSLRD